MAPTVETAAAISHDGDECALTQEARGREREFDRRRSSEGLFVGVGKKLREIYKANDQQTIRYLF